MSIAVVGGGIFGCVIAKRLAQKTGNQVTLFEKNKILMNDTSLVNQCRLHRGFHYPRSLETMMECQTNYTRFEKEFMNCIVHDNKHYYAIPKHDSLLTPQECELNWSMAGLNDYYSSTNDFKDELNGIEAVYNVREKQYNPIAIRNQLTEELQKHPRVNVVTGVQFTPQDAKGKWDYIINATYSRRNFLAKETRPLQLELIEKVIIPTHLGIWKTSIVVADGPFCCVDPVPWMSGYSMIGSVTKAIHSIQITEDTCLPSCNQIGAGPIPSYKLDKDISKAHEIIDHVAHYIPVVAGLEPVASMFTWRAVLPNREHDDARPTLVTRDQHQPNLLNVMSGKFSACFEAADKVERMIYSR